jgi:hypothetical protein
VDSAHDKLRKLLHDCKASANKFNYFRKNSFEAINMCFHRSLSCQQNITQGRDEEQLHQLSERGCTSTV